MVRHRAPPTRCWRQLPSRHADPVYTTFTVTFWRPRDGGADQDATLAESRALDGRRPFESVVPTTCRSLVPWPAMRNAVITIGIDPDIDLGPLTLAWHGLTIALGVAAGLWLASRDAEKRGHSAEPLFALTGALVIAGIVGGRVFYVIEHGGSLFGTRGFTFSGGVILAAITLAVMVRRQRLGTIYLDLIAAALPLGVAIGRIGDVINGEHYGPRSDWLLAVRNSHPDALTPDPALAYHSGGLYEVLLALIVFALVWPLRKRLPRPGDVAWLVLALFAVGRFLEMFARRDSPELALGLDNAQWTSLVMLIGVVLGRAALVRRAAQHQGATR